MLFPILFYCFVIYWQLIIYYKNPPVKVDKLINCQIYWPQSTWESDAVVVVVFPVPHEEQEPEPADDL